MTKTIKTQIQFIYEWKQGEEIYVKSISELRLYAKIFRSSL